MKLIAAYQTIDKKKWSAFLNDHPNGNIFHTHEIHEVYKKTKNYEPVILSVVDEKNEILGVLLAVIQKEHSGLLGRFSARSIIWGGPLVKDDKLDVLNFILKEYNEKIKKKAIYTQFRNLWEWTEKEKNIFIKNDFDFEDHLDIIHDLTITLEEQIMKMNQGRRKNIRRAQKQGVSFGEIETKQELSEALTLIKRTYKKVKLPMPDDSLFMAAFNILYPQEIVKFFKATYQEKVIGVRFVFCFNNLIYDWFAGSSEDHLDKYPNDYLPWKVMEWGANNRYKYFDFGGAGNPNVPYGVRDYKMKFGGELVELGRFEKIHNPILMNIAKAGLMIYRKFN